MDQNVFQGKWNEVKGKIKQRWGKLTDDDMTKAEGDFDSLVGSIQKSYGITEDKAREELKAFKGGLEDLAGIKGEAPVEKEQKAG